MTQNIYDNDIFFEGYAKLPRSVGGLDAAPEWPVLRAMLPDLDGLDILDLGCGYGWFCRWARANGAARALGVDVSEKMLTRAKADTSDAAIAYAREDLETIALKAGTFDVVYSSLALHYITQLDRLAAQVHAALRPGGAFVFSVEHPMFTAPSTPAWVPDAKGRRSWPVNGYAAEGARRTEWLAPGVIKQHRTTATYLNTLLRADFGLDRVEEWVPTPEQVVASPQWADERERPAFLLISARRDGNNPSVLALPPLKPLPFLEKLRALRGRWDR